MEDLQNLKEHGRPDVCVMEVSYSCMFRCKMCNYWKSEETPADVGTGDSLEFISSLKDILGGQRELVFSGGEPLLRNDILELVRFGTKNDLKTLLASNGYLINEDMAKRIKDSGLKEIFISLDSTNYKTHDFLRGIDGAYERTMQAFDNLNRHCPELRVGIITVISGVNYHEIVDLVKWVKETGFLSGINFQAIAQPFFVPLFNRWHTSSQYDFLWPKHIKDMHSVLDKLIMLREEGCPIHNLPLQLEVFKKYFENPTKRAREISCYLGDRLIMVNPVGDISLCCFMPPIGNIKKDNIRELWYSDLAIDKRAKMHNCDLNCNNMVNCFFKEE